jgi:hypothetical protein
MKSDSKDLNMKRRSMFRREKGNALIMVALVLPVLLGMAGLALDWGRGVWVKTSLQKAADAGALAGATRMPSHSDAEAEAKRMVTANFADPDKAEYTPLSGYYRVRLSENVPTFFMGLFGHPNMDVGVSATASIKRPVGGLRGGAWPFAVINPELNNDPTDDLVPSNWGRKYIIEYGEDNIMVPDWANGSLGLPAVPDANSRGWRGSLKLNADGSMDGTAGADDLVYCMTHGWPGTANIGDPLLTKCGNIDQPVEKGRTDLLGGNPLPWADFDPRTDNEISRVVLVPIVHLVHSTRGDTYTVQDFNNGADYQHDYVILDGFAPFFIMTANEQGDVDGNGKLDDRDWVVGYFIPGVQTEHFLPPVSGNPNYGLYSPPRLVD